ncbi:helix-turn-helix transcriptional regulator [Parapedobacter sp. ISTM3]|uniref:AraC-type DNA-binding protein n=1 Tax=Parapedobacter luteus TaxID=623280 RepID=A0A1T5AGT0_9SPHI|nr:MULTISPECIES: AraC family transcriptional regulator [Parapedobacter]MBK1441829.1 helix-turn-helix transcriptional regulator [Parapedobacter sp. ISTM3]SKB34115.1 AraC-type DNA-binding protein [Parapedobacter luteus]
MDFYQHFPLTNIQGIGLENPDDMSATIHLSHDGLGVFSASSQRYQHAWVTDCQTEPILTMYFSMVGICQAKEKHCPKIYELRHNHHILSFSPYFEGMYSVKGERIDTFGVSMTERHFKRLMVSELDCLQRFWEKVSRSEEADIAPFPLPITPLQKILIHELQHCAYTGEMKKLFYESKIAELFLAQALQAETAYGMTTQDLSSPDRARLHAAKAFIEKNMLEPLNMRRICQETGLNDFKLKKGFKELFGTTVFEYFTRLRMEYARKLLLDTSHHVNEVAYTLGYGDPYNFTKAFKKHFGYLPSKLKV